MPDGHRPATPQVPAMDDQFGTHRLNRLPSADNSWTDRANHVTLVDGMKGYEFSDVIEQSTYANNALSGTFRKTHDSNFRRMLF
jgi:hypothetical protein